MPTPRRKGWDQLSDKYRARLEKNGVSKRDYDSGGGLRSARGHSATPERPTGAAAFPDYQRERIRLTDKVVYNKHFYFSTSPKYNMRKERTAFIMQPPPLRLLRYWGSLTKEEWVNAIRENPETAKYLGYH